MANSVKLTKMQGEALERARYYSAYTQNHYSTELSRKLFQKCEKFYDGHQNDEESIKLLFQRGQVPLTFNKINTMINALCGVEIQRKFRVGVASHSMREEDERLSRFITNYLLFIQQYQKIPYKDSLKFTDICKVGIGWSGMILDDYKGWIYEYVNYWNMYTDPDDLTPQYTDSKFLRRDRWLDCDIAARLWPKFEDNFQFIQDNDPNIGYGSQSGELLDRASPFPNNQDFSGKRARIVEVQYKEPATSYRGKTQDGRFFETFNYKNALELCDKKTIEKDETSSKIMRVIYCADMLLEFSPLRPSIPGQKDFSYVPSVFMRDFETGIPYGLVYLMMDAQMEINTRQTKALFYANSKRAIIDSQNLDGKNVEYFREEIKRPDSVLIREPGSQIEIQDNAPLVDTQIKLLEKAEQQLRAVSGIHDEFLGAQTNATSEVGMKRRIIQSVKSHVTLFDNLKFSKERVGELMLCMLQGGGSENILAQIMAEDERDYIILNLVEETPTGKIIHNDIRTLPMSLYIEEIPDFESSSEEKRENIKEILSLPGASNFLKSPTLLKSLGYKQGDIISKEFMEFLQMENNMQQGQGAMQPQQQQPNGEGI